MHGFKSMPWLWIQQVSLKACTRWDSTCDRMMVVSWIDEPSTSLDSRHRDSARGPSNLVPWRRDHYFVQFWKLGFCSVSECPISTHRGHLCKFLDREHVASIPTWNLPKHIFMTYLNPVLMHDFHSMPRVGIQHVSLKAYRRWDSTCHRMMVLSWINELSNSLDSWHWDSFRGGPLLWVHGQGILF